MVIRFVKKNSRNFSHKVDFSAITNITKTKDYKRAKKLFIFSTLTDKRLFDRKSGNNIGFRIYKIGKGEVINLGWTEANTHSFKGAENVVHDWLVANGHIKKPVYEEGSWVQSNAYYKVGNDKYTIKGI